MLPQVQDDADKLDAAARFFWSRSTSEAQALFAKAVKVAPANARVICDFGLFYEYQLKNFAEAAALYKRALKANSKYGRAYLELGKLFEKRRKNYAAAKQQYRRALAVSPQDADAIQRLAWVLAHRGRKLDEAEKLMRQRVELTKTDANAVGSLAILLWHYRKNYVDAQKQFVRAVALDPQNANNVGNYSAFLLAQADMNVAEKQILEAWSLTFGEKNQITAEVAFYRCICLKLQNKPDSSPLSYLKHLFATGYERSDWRFDDVLEKIDGKLSRLDVQFYKALSEAILDSGKVEHLNTFERWKKVKPRPLSKEI